MGTVVDAMSEPSRYSHKTELPRFLPDEEINLTFLDSISARDKHPHHKEALVLSCSFWTP